MPTSHQLAVKIDVYLELGAKRVFASAAVWPGWSWSGKDEQQALAALAAAAPRYAVVAQEAGLAFPTVTDSDFDVVERLFGSATTDFGAPASIAAGESALLSPKESERLAKLLRATWSVFDRIVASAPSELRKGPRGGGRDRDRVVEHVIGAEAMYARKIGMRIHEPAPGDAAAIAEFRDAIVGALRTANGTNSSEKGWPARYAARRIAWHVLDHAWEIEDRST